MELIFITFIEVVVILIEFLLFFENNVPKYGKDGRFYGDYDLKITEIYGLGIRNYTFCNYQ